MISGPSSYISTIEEFLAHWARVNADAAAGGGLETRDGKTRADLVALRTTLNDSLSDVQDKLNGKEIDRARVENAKGGLLARSQELGRRLRGMLPVDSPYLKALPEMPLQSSAQEAFLKPVRDCFNLWTRVAGAGMVFKLSENFALADYETALDALVELYGVLNTAIMDLKLAREMRNKLQTAARALLGGYRPAVEGLFAPDSPLVLTIPLLSPKPGHTPEPVAAQAVYDAAANESVITFTESNEADLAEYQVRGVPGAEYDGEDEVVLATIPKGAPREYRTDFSLSEPGTAASFKVFVVLTSGNEAGSNTVTVARP
jgi:hypothetical protein